jgi:dihydroorotate dehydrogenase (fumarate)
VMTASALIRHGPGHVGVLLDGLSGWMARKGYPSVAGVRGMLALPAGTDRAAYEREGYVRAMRAANSSHGPW